MSLALALGFVLGILLTAMLAAVLDWRRDRVRQLELDVWLELMRQQHNK